MASTKYFEYITDKVAAAKREADVLSRGLDHNGLAGQIREIAVRNCIAPFLTHSFKVGSGKIVDSVGTVSDQIDLVVYQKKSVPPIMFAEELGLFPIESVKYVFEIKSTLTAAEVRDSIKKFQSVKRMLPFPRPTKDGTSYGVLPPMVIFAFSSDISGDELDRYLKYDGGEIPAATVLCILGKGYWHWNKGWVGLATDLVVPPMTEFAAFITGLMNTLAGEETTMRPFNPGLYVDIDNLLKEHGVEARYIE